MYRLTREERAVKKDLEKKGFTVLKTDYAVEAELPDFRCFNFDDSIRFFVEVKSVGQSLTERQEKTIKRLIHSGNEVRLATVSTKEIEYHKLDKNLTKNFIEKSSIPVEDRPRVQKCPKCGYQWEPKVEIPKRCPRCQKWLIPKGGERGHVLKGGKKRGRLGGEQK